MGNAADFERLLAWRHFSRRSEFGECLAKSRPQPASRLLLTARHVVQDGELVPTEFVFSIEEGFQAALRPDAWVVPLIARLNGKRSVREVFESARSADELPGGFTLEAFMELVQRMIEKGFSLQNTRRKLLNDLSSICAAASGRPPACKQDLCNFQA